MNWLIPEILKFLIFLRIPLLVELVVPEWTNIGVSLMIALTVNIFESMRV